MRHCACPLLSLSERAGHVHFEGKTDIVNDRQSRCKKKIKFNLTAPTLFGVNLCHRQSIHKSGFRSMREFIKERRISTPPKLIEEKTFYCYQVGNNRYEWRSENMVVRLNYNATTYSGYLGLEGGQQQCVGRNFLDIDGAARACVKTARSVVQVLLNN
jgi:hypothetical protein